MRPFRTHASHDAGGRFSRLRESDGGDILHDASLDRSGADGAVGLAWTDLLQQVITTSLLQSGSKVSSAVATFALASGCDNVTTSLVSSVVSPHLKSSLRLRG